MARKRRAPSPPPPQESSTDSGSDTGEEEESPRAAAHQKPPQNPQPHPPAAAADGADSSDEEPDSDADADAFQMRPVSRTPTKPAAPGPQPESDADEEGEESESSESEPEVPEPVQKKAAATTNKSKAAEPVDKKRLAPEPAPSGRAKKAKAETGKAASEATSAGKGKKANAGPEKAAPAQSPSGKAKKPGGKPENPGLDPSPPTKSARVRHTWSKEDLIKILEAMAAHVKSEGALPKTDALLAAVRHRLDRKDCSYTDIYERVRRFKDRYEKAVKAGVVPSGEDELQMYKLSEAIWGEEAKEAMAAAASQNNSTVTKSKKGLSKKEKMDGNSKGGTLSEVPNQIGDTQKGSKKGHASEVKTDKDVKSKLSNEDTTAATPSKSKKVGNGKQELGKDAKSGTSKETATTASQNGDAVTKRKGEKMDKDKMDIDLMPKEASTGSQNGGARIEEETHQEETEIGASVQGTHRSFDELQDLYPCLAGCVKSIEAQHPCGETLKRAFGLMGNEKANVLESKVKAQRLLEVKAQIRRADLQKEVLNMLISLAD